MCDFCKKIQERVTLFTNEMQICDSCMWDRIPEWYKK